MAEIFISYSTKHPVYAYLIEKSIDDEGRYHYWRDVRRIQPGESWQAQIEQGIQDATIVIVIVTEEAIASVEVKREVDLALKLKKKIVPVIMERIRDIGEALGTLQLAHLQPVNFVTEELRALNTLKAVLQSAMDNWTPVEKQIQRLGHFSSIVRQRAVMELGLHADLRALPSLLETLEVDDSHLVQLTILRELSHFGDYSAVEALLRFAVWSDKFEPIAHEYKAATVDSLRELQHSHPWVEEYLKDALTEKDDLDLRIRTAGVLARMDSPLKEVGFGCLETLLQEGDKHARASVVMALGGIYDKLAFDILSALQNNVRPDDYAELGLLIKTGLKNLHIFCS